MRHPKTPILRGSAAIVLCMLVALALPAAHADPADFQAMPGLWRIVLHVMDHGRAGPAQVKWRCLNEGGDPWAFFTDLPVATGAHCRRGDARRGSTSLSWTLTCPGAQPLQGTGRVDFDSAEHYTGNVEIAGRGEVLRVEGTRRAACTGPND